jgi:hypothetical protein
MRLAPWLVDWLIDDWLVDAQSGDQEVGERADADRVADGADADRAAEQPAHAEHGELDQRAHPAGRPASAGQAGHQPVPGARTEPGAEVQAGRDRVGRDAPGQHRRALRERGRVRQPGQRGVEHQADDDHVADRAETGALTQRDPQQQHGHRRGVDHPADRQAGPAGQALVQHVPRVEAEAGVHQERDAEAEQHQPAVQADQPPPYRWRHPSPTS